jgi:hypothetical protein
MHAAKNALPPNNRIFGVALATPRQPRRSNSRGDSSISPPVTTPDQVATSPAQQPASASIHVRSEGKAKRQTEHLRSSFWGGNITSTTPGQRKNLRL